MRPTSDLRLRLLALLLSCAACDSAPPEPTARHTVRLALQSHHDTAPPVQEIVLRCRPGELAGWFVQDEEGAPREVRGGGAPLELEPSARPVHVTIPLPELQKPFNRVVLMLRTKRRLSLRVRAQAPDEQPVVTDLQEVAGGPSSQTLVLDLPRERVREDWLPSNLRVTAEIAHGTWELEAVDLIWLGPRLPSSEQGPELVRVGEEARRAVGLAAGRPLRARVSVPERARLSFSFAWPENCAPATGQADLLAQVEGAGDREVLGRWTLTTPSSDEAPEWVHQDFSLEPWAGREVTLLFEIPACHPPGAVIALGEPHVYVPADEPPTVLLITSDTHRGDHVGSARGAVDVRTPNIDALAERGVYFENCLASTNVTIPSHAALMTATHPRDTGVLTNLEKLVGTPTTLTEHFARAGYVTLAVTSMRRLTDASSGLGQGFDRLSAPAADAQRTADVSVDRLSTWLAAFESRPVFVWLHVADAHGPYEPPAEFAELYGAGVTEAERALRAGLRPQRGERMLHYQHLLLDQPGWIETMRGRYRGEVTFLDEQLARMLDVPRVRDGIVALTADHGELLGENQIFWSHSSGLNHRNLHVPLAIAWPGGPRGLRVDFPVRQIDVGRTLLDLAGIHDAPFPGRSLAVALAEEGASDDLRFGLASGAKSCSMSTGPWHLTLQLRRHTLPAWAGGKESKFRLHELKLYNVEMDPGCLTDLAAEEPERARRMRAALISWLADARADTWRATGVSRDKELLADLAALGYATDQESPSSRELFDPECGCPECERFR